MLFILSFLQTVLETCSPLVNEPVTVSCFYGTGNELQGDILEIMDGRGSARCRYMRSQAVAGGIIVNVNSNGVQEPICRQIQSATGMSLTLTQSANLHTLFPCR